MSSRSVYFELFTNIPEANRLLLRLVTAELAALKGNLIKSDCYVGCGSTTQTNEAPRLCTDPGFDDSMLLEKLLRSMYNEATNFEILHFDEHLQDKNLQVNQAVSLQMNILA